MTQITYHVPAFDADEAREIAYGVHAGRIGHIEHYLEPAAAQRVCDHLNRLGSKRREVFPIEVEARVTDDGRIPVARVSLGDVAAALILFVAAPMVMAAGWGLWS